MKETKELLIPITFSFVPSVNTGRFVWKSVKVTGIQSPDSHYTSLPVLRNEFRFISKQTGKRETKQSGEGKSPLPCFAQATR